MTTITIRDVPETTHAELSARAALAGQSLQEYLRSQLIEVAQKPDVMTVMERIRARKRVTGTVLPAETIVGYKDEDRR